MVRIRKTKRCKDLNYGILFSVKIKGQSEMSKAEKKSDDIKLLRKTKNVDLHNCLRLSNKISRVLKSCTRTLLSIRFTQKVLFLKTCSLTVSLHIFNDLIVFFKE